MREYAVEIQAVQTIYVEAESFAEAKSKAIDEIDMRDFEISGVEVYGEE